MQCWWSSENLFHNLDGSSSESSYSADSNTSGDSDEYQSDDGELPKISSSGNNCFIFSLNYLNFNGPSNLSVCEFCYSCRHRDEVNAHFKKYRVIL